MDRLKQQVNAMIVHVGTLPPAPSAEQLRAKVTALSDSLTKDTLAMAKRFQDIVHNGFVSMGWDSKRRVVIKKELFVLEALAPALRRILSDLLNADKPPVPPPTAAELADISLAAGRLWDLDEERLVPGLDYRINVQRGKKMWDEGDMAAEPLFTFLDPNVLKRPTTAAFIALLDNYSAELGVTEVVDRHEHEENRLFIDLILTTPCMQYVFVYLQRANKTRAQTKEQFAAELHQVWFGLYTRKRTNDSSGFEHVFVGEIKDDEIVGFHNWIQIYLEEKKGAFDYQGFIKPKRPALPSRISQENAQLISLQFKWHGALKKVSSSYIGTSPEFEFALYTLCYYMHLEESVLQTGPYKVQITVHRWKAGSKEHIATSFPSDAPLDENEAATKIQARARGRTAPAPNKR